MTTLKALPKTRKERIVLFIKFVLLIALIVLQIRFPDLGKTLRFSNKYLNGLLFYITANLVIDFSRLLLIELYLRRYREAAQANFVLGVNRIASILSFIVLIVAVFIAFNIEVAKVLTSLSIVAAAIAITFKDYISNFINGLLMMFTDDISLGDYVEIGKNRGEIIDITLINVHLQSDDHDLIYIPNTTVMNSDVINYTKRIINRVSFQFSIGYDYLHNIQDLEEFLKGILDEFTTWIEPDSFNLKTNEIHKDYAVLNCQYTLREADKNIEFKIRRRIARKVIEYVNLHTKR